MLALTAALVAWSASATLALAVDTGTLRGFVTDTNGRAIAGAHVTASIARSSFGAVSTADGSFTISSMPQGVYSIDVTARGFQRLSDQIVEVNAGETSDVNLTLSQQSASAMATIGRVTVNGSNALSTASAPTTDLAPQDLAGRGVEQLSQILGDQIALTLTRQMGGAPGLPESASIRGPDPSETVVDIDGHQVNNSNTGDFDLELMDPAEYSSVQVVYGIGPSSLVGANTQGGAINFRTIEPTTEDHGLLRFTAGSFGTFGETAQATGTDGQFGYALSWHHYTTQGETRDFSVIDSNTGLPVELGSGVNGVSTLAKLRYTLDGGLGFAEVTYRNTAASRDLSAGLSTPVNPANAGEGAVFDTAQGASDETNAPAFGVDLSLPVGALDASGAVTASLVARHLTSTSDESTPNVDPALNPYLIDQRDQLSDDSLEYDRYAGDSTFTLEGDIRHEQLTAPVVLAPGPGTQSQTQRSFVARDEWSPTSHLHYTLAAYASRYDTFGSSIDPRVAIVWTPSADAIFRASVGSGFRAPLLAERAFNPNLTAERTTEYELGYQARLGDGERPVSGELNLYRTNLRDPIFFTVNPDGSLAFLENLGFVVYQGAELRFDAPLAGGTELQAAYGVDIAYPVDNPFAFDPAAPNVVAGEQFQSIPPRKATLSAIHDQGGLLERLDATYESSNNELNRPAYALFNATVAKTFGQTQIALSALNLTNQFDDRFTLPGAGVPYPTPGGLAPTDAFSLQGQSVSVTITRRL
ncbi:MAG TPA: TonB-dependent receptor [Candidatus Eremiobacteraceae bacterium]|nr:TonB-dependent receptor [Candidatus Eremiobacteraceae bacterium]